jgi:hypothetical protein
MKFNKFFLTLIAISTLKAIVRSPEQLKELQQHIDRRIESCNNETFEDQERSRGRNPEDTPPGFARAIKKAKNLQECLETSSIATTSVPGNNNFWDLDFWDLDSYEF